jgi:predicted acylesterase/phospholipase RssA
MAHIGALKALEASGRPIAGIAGTSFGAIMASLYALGGHALELERVVRSQDVAEIWRQGLDFGLHRGAVIHGRRLADWLDRKFFFGATFDDVRLPLAVACTDLVSGEPVVIRSGSVAAAVRASCALPGVFAPVPVDGRVLIDGGFVETVPFRALGGFRAETKIGVHAGVDVRHSRMILRIRRFNASRLGRTFYRTAARLGSAGPFGQMARGLAISLRSYSRSIRAPQGHVLVSVDPGVAWWDFHRSPQAIAAGERAMTQALAQGPLPGMSVRTSMEQEARSSSTSEAPPLPEARARREGPGA